MTGAPHDRPTAAELLAAVEEFLRDELLPTVEGRLGFHVRVAANVVSMVGRQIVLGEGQSAAHRERLASLGFEGDAELAKAIRSGELDSRVDEVRRVVRESVAAKLEVANPGYLQG